MANITVNFDGQNHVYNAVVPSAGDKSPAMWRYDNANHDVVAGSSVGQLSAVTCTSRFNGTKTARYVEWKFDIPNIVGGQPGTAPVSNGKETVTCTFVLPQNAPAAFHAHAARMISGFLASALAVSVNETGFAPT
jgi:hypothetical protein